MTTEDPRRRIPRTDRVLADPAVHAAGGKIVSQLWHLGRVVHPSLPGRGQPVSSSATTMPGSAWHPAMTATSPVVSAAP